MFFRKKGKYTDVEGYNRISRLIEDRQREMTDHAGLEPDFDEESVLLTREPIPRERTGLLVPDDAPPASAVRPLPRANEDALTSASPSPFLTPASDERRIPFQAAAAEAETQAPALPISPEAAEQPFVPSAPAMLVPDLGKAPAGCLVAAEAVWEGKLATSGNVRVEGVLRGEVEAGSTLFVAAKARIEGTVHARNVMLAGEIEGQVTCSDRLEILPGGSARGDIETATLVVHEGAFIDSRFQMRKAAAQAHG